MLEYLHGSYSYTTEGNESSFLCSGITSCTSLPPELIDTFLEYSLDEINSSFIFESIIFCYCSGVNASSAFDSSALASSYKVSRCYSRELEQLRLLELLSLSLEGVPSISSWMATSLELGSFTFDVCPPELCLVNGLSSEDLL